MDVKLTLKLHSSTYCLIFTFDSTLKDIDFTATPIDTLIYIYISQVSSDKYTITDQSIDGNTLTLTLKFLSNLSVSIGYALFLDNSPFMSGAVDAVLN